MSVSYCSYCWRASDVLRGSAQPSPPVRTSTTLPCCKRRRGEAIHILYLCPVCIWRKIESSIGEVRFVGGERKNNKKFFGWNVIPFCVCVSSLVQSWQSPQCGQISFYAVDIHGIHTRERRLLVLLLFKTWVVPVCVHNEGPSLVYYSYSRIALPTRFCQRCQSPRIVLTWLEIASSS